MKMTKKLVNTKPKCMDWEKSANIQLNSCQMIEKCIYAFDLSHSVLVKRPIYFDCCEERKENKAMREKERETNTTKVHLTFSRWKMHLLIRICCISFIQFGNHVPFTFLIGRALVSAPFISILINIFLVCGMCFLPFGLRNTGIEHRLIETEIMITAKAVHARNIFFSASDQILLFSLSLNYEKEIAWFGQQENPPTHNFLLLMCMHILVGNPFRSPYIHWAV